MAAHFNLKLYNFEKEGKGVEKDEKKPVAFLRVFILYFRNFWKMTLFNLIRFGAAIPILATAVSLVVIMMGEEAINSFIMTEDFQNFNQSYPWIMILVNIYHFFTGNSLKMALGIVLLLASALCFGPLSAGMAYISRNTSREEHTFATDIFSVGWENKKQAIPMGLLDLTATAAILLYFFYDFAAMNPGYGILMDFLKYFAVIVYVFYLVFRIYAYMIMVTFEMPFGEILKNAFILTYSNLPRTLIIWATTAAVVFLNVILPLPSLLLLPLFDISFVSFVSGFICFSPLDRLMIQPTIKLMEEQADKEKKEKEEKEAAIALLRSKQQGKKKKR
ncbi:MAG: hypothetical protein IKX85_07655 [Clostridia bacterium]|nr:hypothetical protein [Clostridia bacterium]